MFLERRKIYGAVLHKEKWVGFVCILSCIDLVAPLPQLFGYLERTRGRERDVCLNTKVVPFQKVRIRRQPMHDITLTVTKLKTYLLFVAEESFFERDPPTLLCVGFFLQQKVPILFLKCCIVAGNSPPPSQASLESLFTSFKTLEHKMRGGCW